MLVRLLEQLCQNPFGCVSVCVCAWVWRHKAETIAFLVLYKAMLSLITCLFPSSQREPLKKFLFYTFSLFVRSSVPSLLPSRLIKCPFSHFYREYGSSKTQTILILPTQIFYTLPFRVPFSSFLLSFPIHYPYNVPNAFLSFHIYLCISSLLSVSPNVIET